MKRVSLLAAAALAALAFALPATAGTTAFRGVVIAKKAGRHAFVTASKNGVVRTVRARGRSSASASDGGSRFRPRLCRTGRSQPAA
jgi:hypothetical protein